MDGLATSRLLLPPLTRDHLPEVAALCADPEVGRYIGAEGLTDEILAAHVEQLAQEWSARGYGTSAATTRTPGEFVGTIGLHYWPHWDEVELGYILKRSAQGRGLAAEGSRAWIEWAVAAAGIDSLIANIAPLNAPSIALAEKLGFTFERPDVTPTGKPTLIYRLPTGQGDSSSTVDRGPPHDRLR